MTTGHWMRLLLAAAILGAAGCLQLETKIKFKEDGSATVTERLNFSQRLLEMAKGDKGGTSLESLLTREAAAERAKQMGPGVTLASHELREGEKGSRESLATYEVPDLTNLVYVSPFVGWRGYQAQGLKISMAPNLTWGEWRRQAVTPGSLIITFESRPYPAGAAGGKKEAAASATNSPLDVQAFREIAPVFADLLEDLRIRITFEAYCTIGNYHGLAHRDESSRVKHTDLMNISGKQMDKYGYGFIENEEIMVDLLLGHLGLEAREPASYGPFWSDHLRGMQENPTLPLIHQGSRAAVMLAPSPALFKKHLEGKTLDWTGAINLAIKARGKKLADFDEVGWRPQVFEAKNTGDVCPTNCPWCR